MMQNFNFSPAPWIPIRDKAVLERVRKLSGEELTRHPNTNFKIQICKNPGRLKTAHLFSKIQESDREDKPFVAILGNPAPTTYEPLADLINYMGVSCRNFYPFTMDEWADQDGNIAPATYRSGFTYSFLKYFISRIREDLRPPEKNVFYPTTQNIKDYSKLICEKGDGGADTIYSGPGWAGHIAFIDPCPELIPDYREGGEYIIKDLSDPYFEQPAQVLTIHPLTIVQNSLHGVFGQSGDLANVPPKAATIGPLDVVNARERIESHGITTGGQFTSWQRMTSRLILHGPVTPYMPGSILQLMDTTVLVSESIAAPIECMETVGY
jgi:glucosamine-6-phosphate deaminase